MASQITIGRFGLDIETTEIDRWDMSGDTVRVSGECFCGTAAIAKAVRQQVLGLANNPDEPIVPVTWVEDTTLDGWYEVTAASCEILQTTLLDGVLPWSVTLRRPQGSASMVTEHILNGAARDGASGAGLTPRYWLGVAGPSSWSSSSGSPTSPTGLVRYPYNDTDGRSIIEHSSLSDAVVTAVDVAANHYDGAAILKMGSTPYIVVGRQIPNSPTEWEITNNLVKLTSPADPDDLFDVEFYPPSGSDLPTVTYAVELGYFDGAWTPSTLSPKTISCARNAPSEVSVRIAGATNRIVDISLRRGDRGVVVTIQGNSFRHGLGWVATSASTAIDAKNLGVYKTTADADANQPILVGAGTPTIDTTNGRVYRSTAGTSCQMYVGYTYTGAAAPDTAVWLQEAFFAAMAETARMVSR